MTESTNKPGLPIRGLNTQKIEEFKESTAPGRRIAQEDTQKRLSAFEQARMNSEPVPKSASDEYFEDYFGDDSEEIALGKAQNKIIPEYAHSNKYSEIEARMTKSLRELREKYPAGGLKSFRFIDTDLLIDAPADYFYRYEKDVREITTWVQATISEKGLADVVGAAQQNPFDEEIQDKAFRATQNLAMEYMERLSYKGVERAVLVYLASMDIVGMSRIDPIWRDKSVDEIIINGPNDIQIERSGKLIKVPACRFGTPEHLENMLERIFGTIGKSLSRTTPYLDGRLYDQSRIAATHRRISPAGPNVAIRRHPEKYWTPMDLISYGAGSEEMFTEIGNLINKGCSAIVIGGTSSGKTSLLNALSGFFEPTQRVLTLEDTLELKPHPGKWIGAPMECVPANPNNAADRGISMRDLVKACLRMRPDGIVVGEVRDGAMYDLCQALNTGHWGLSTVHANSPRDGIYRMQSLVTQAELIGPEQALPLIAAAFDLILMQERFPQDGSRKITSVCEIDPYTSVGDDGRVQLGINPIWEFKPEDDLVDGRVVGEWKKVGEISEVRKENRHLNLTRNKTWEELVKLCTIPDEFIKKDVN